jgi:hypothetical protein
MTTPNRYMLIDDYTSTSSYGSGAASGQQLSPEFTAFSDADAQTVAGNFAILFGRTVRLVKLGGSPPWTPTFAPTGCLTPPSAVPPSIGY